MEKHRVKLESFERDFLETFISKGKSSSRKLTRSRILLLADEGLNGPGLTDTEIIDALLTSESTVTRTRKAFVFDGLEKAVSGKKRTEFRSRVLDGKGEARLVAIACSEPPDGRDKWTMQLLADQLIELSIVDTISDETVRLTLKKTKSSPG